MFSVVIGVSAEGKLFGSDGKVAPGAFIGYLKCVYECTMRIALEFD